MYGAEKVPAGQVVAAVRTPDKAGHLQAKGIAMREADYARPNTLAAALRG